MLEADADGFGRSARESMFMSRPFLSANGRYAAFTSRAPNLVEGDRNGMSDVFVHDLVTGRTTRVSVSADGEEANGDSFVSGISADGRVVAFTSLADNLVAGDTNGRKDVFVAWLDPEPSLLRASQRHARDAPPVSGGGGIRAYEALSWLTVQDERQ